MPGKAVIGGADQDQEKNSRDRKVTVWFQRLMRRYGLCKGPRNIFPYFPVGDLEMMMMMIFGRDNVPPNSHDYHYIHTMLQGIPVG